MHPIQPDSLTACLFPRERAGVLARLMLDQDRCGDIICFAILAIRLYEVIG
jgi:hypothetical protein